MKPVSQADKIIVSNTQAVHRLIFLMREARAIREAQQAKAVNE